MRFGPKPVHKCYTCLLNLGDQCWEFDCPREKWSSRKCEGFDNEKLHNEYRNWLEEPHVKTRKQLRREAFRTRDAEPRKRHPRTVCGKKSR